MEISPRGMAREGKFRLDNVIMPGKCSKLKPFFFYSNSAVGCCPSLRGSPLLSLSQVRLKGSLDRDIFQRLHFRYPAVNLQFLRAIMEHFD